MAYITVRDDRGNALLKRGPMPVSLGQEEALSGKTIFMVGGGILLYLWLRKKGVM